MQMPKERKILFHVLRTVICVAVLVFGIAISRFLASRKQPPAEREAQERVLTVAGMVGRPAEYPLVITGHGEVMARDVLRLSAQVSGVVTSVHPRLEPGEIIAAGEILFSVDDRTYAARVAEATALVAGQSATLARLQEQLRREGERLATLERSRELALKDFKRVYRLFKEQQVGTQAEVDAAERSFNAAKDQAALLAQAVSILPIQVREVESNRAAAEARLQAAEVALERCRVAAPFHARVTSVMLEANQFVAPGEAVVVLADDARLELHVPLDSQDARTGLPFAVAARSAADGWFRALEPVSCNIRWTEDEQDNVFRGRLDRVVAFDRGTRTVTVAVQVLGSAKGVVSEAPFPLVDGMFCRVEIPGGTLKDVYRLPRASVSFDGTAFVVISNRLKTVSVDVQRSDGDHVYVSSGLWPGAEIITTRLINPLENTLVAWSEPPLDAGRP